MQIFILDEDPQAAARAHYDTHVGKGILEIAQIFSTAAHLSGADEADVPYRPTHREHPCVRWVRGREAHLEWTMALCEGLFDEHIRRFRSEHSSHEAARIARRLVQTLSRQDSRDFAWLADRNVPERFASIEDPIERYRAYYKTDKSELMQYTNREPPFWIGENWIGEKTTAD